MQQRAKIQSAKSHAKQMRQLPLCNRLCPDKFVSCNSFLNFKFEMSYQLGMSTEV